MLYTNILNKDWKGCCVCSGPLLRLGVFVEFSFEKSAAIVNNAYVWILDLQIAMHPLQMPAEVVPQSP